ncbi:MAG: hypothetical protein ABIQ06_15290 [Caldimonas sp.]
MNRSSLVARPLRLAAALFVAIGLAACGGSDEEETPASRATIGAAGGTLAGPGGAQIVVPAGALAQPTQITIAQDDAGAPPLPTGSTAFGPMFALTPHGTGFAAPATISVPFDPALAAADSVPTMMKTNAAQDGWEVVAGAVVTGSTMQAQIKSFSWVIILDPPVLPTIAVAPADQSVVEPNAATFSVGATGPTLSGVIAFQWRRNGAAIFGANSSSFTTGPTTIAADNGAIYSVDVTNRGGTVFSRGATLTVTSAIVAPAISQEPADASVAVGANATFTVVASGTSLIYQWKRSIDGGITFDNINDANAASLTVSNAQLADNGLQFKVHLSNAAGMLDSRAAVLTVTAPPPPPPPPAQGARIAAGGTFSIAVDRAGVPYSWGDDLAGQLGNGEPNVSRSTAAPLGTLPGVRSVAAGGSYQGVAVRIDGTVWAWGYRGYVDCALGNLASTPFQIAGAAGITALSAGQDHTLLLRSDKAVLAYGCNGHRQLGQPTQQVPEMGPATVVAGLPPIKAVAAGDQSSFALDEAGEVWAWGRMPGDRSSASSASNATPTKVAGLSGVIAIALAEDHALALKNDGSVWAWGSNRNGKLGDGTEIDRPTPTATLLTAGVTAVCAGGDISLALRNDGTVMSWGINETGQLGSGSASPGFRPQPAPVVGLATVVEIACGSTQLSHALALLADGTVRSWGRNGDGQLGDGSKNSALAPVVVTGLNLN